MFGRIIILQMSAVKISAVSVLLSLCVHCQSQEFPYVSFMGDVLMNHSYVDLSLVGTSQNDRVVCHTNVGTCCTVTQGAHRGDWFFPNGTRLNFSDNGGNIYETRGEQKVALRRRNNESVSGIYQCNIPIRAEGTIARSIYIGLYDMGGEFCLLTKLAPLLSPFTLIGLYAIITHQNSLL